MSKMFVARIGYHDYALPISRGAEFLALMGELRPVKREGYRGPYTFDDKAEHDLVDTLSVATVEDPAPPPVAEAEPAAEPLMIGHEPKRIEGPPDMPF